MITSEQKKLVQTSFEQVLPHAEAMVALFYQRLFELDPALRPLFKISLPEQERKLIDMLCVAVYGLDHINRLLPALHLLGERHVQYGVQPEHYATVSAALMWALEQQLGPRFTPAVHEAWQAAYNLLAESMTAKVSL